MATKKAKTRSEAQKRADKNYEKKRSGRTQLSGYLDEKETSLLLEAAKVFGSKKAGIIGALKFWRKYRHKVGE